MRARPRGALRAALLCSCLPRAAAIPWFGGAALLCSIPLAAAIPWFGGVAPPSPSEHYRLVAAQRASDARSFIALVAGRFPRGTRVYDNFTRALAVYAKSVRRRRNVRLRLASTA